MAQSRRTIAIRFADQVEKYRDTYEKASEQATNLIQEILLNSPAMIHAVTSRCKGSVSLSIKLFEKKYKNPEQEMTDLVAARVITYYKDHVPIVESALRDELEIDPTKSVDKKQDLKVREFGYTSVHLIAKTKGSWASSPKYSALHNRWFEIQVRSILEHSWAEIEHEVVYKSGIAYPPEFRRRFARIAGAIEILDDEFTALREHQEKLIEKYNQCYQKKQDLEADLDSARLIALLECERPLSLGWRKAAKCGMPFPAHIESNCAKAIRQAGVRNGIDLTKSLRSRELKRAEKIFAQELRLSDPVSHLVTARLVVLVNDPTVFSDYFRDLISSAGFERLLSPLKRARR
jgi:ppGpp synthetase/RelA/SpoT-type nucleotidyltranferase